MSFELSVFVSALPLDLIPRWEHMLTRYGLACQFYPSYHPVTWPDRFAPVRVIVQPTAFTFAAFYGTIPLLSEIELDIIDVRTDAYHDLKTSVLQHVPDPLSRTLARANQCIEFNSSAGRTLLQFRLQCFAAATLAVMMDGILIDPQVGGGYFEGDVAAEHAMQRSDAHEQRAKKIDWHHEPFTTWSAWDGFIPAVEADTD